MLVRVGHGCQRRREEVGRDDDEQGRARGPVRRSPRPAGRAGAPPGRRPGDQPGGHGPPGPLRLRRGHGSLHRARVRLPACRPGVVPPPVGGYVVLDTDVASRILRQRLTGPLAGRLVGVRWCVTFVTVSELWKWAELRAWGPDRRDELAQWLSGAIVLPAGNAVSR